MTRVRRVWGNESGSLTGLAGRFGGGGPPSFCGTRGLMREEDGEGGRAGPPAEADVKAEYLAEIARALGEIVSELREVNTSLRAIARSQAQQATQKRTRPES